mgnify:CR=1 FL=1
MDDEAGLNMFIHLFSCLSQQYTQSRRRVAQYKWTLYEENKW